MKLPRRKFLHLAAGAAALPAVSRVAQAQAYPLRPVRIIVGVPAGSATDIAARVIGQWLSERLAQPLRFAILPKLIGNLDAQSRHRRWPHPPVRHLLLNFEIE
jgi:hypothetical protein